MGAIFGSSAPSAAPPPPPPPPPATPATYASSAVQGVNAGRKAEKPFGGTLMAAPDAAAQATTATKKLIGE